MLSPNVLMAEPLGLFRGIGQNAFALIGKRQVDGGRDLFTDSGVLLNLLADAFNRSMGAEEAIGERFVLAQET